jgi:hypothetical protein
VVAVSAGDIHPWGEFIAVNDPPMDPQDGTIGGVVLPPGSSLDALAVGVVIGVGPEVNGPDGFDVGAVIWYQHGHGLELSSASRRDAEAIKMIPRRAVVAWEGSL